MILSPWVFLPLHVFHAYPLSKSLRPLKNEKLAIAITFVFNFCLYLVENWTMTFPGFSRFWYDHELSNLGIVQMVAFLYFSVQTASNNNSNIKRIGNGDRNNKQLVWYWIYAASVLFSTSFILDWGVPKRTMAEQVEATTTDGFHNITHFLNHCFLFVMVWHVSSLAESNDSNDSLCKRIDEPAGATWIKASPLTSSCATCIIVALGAIVIDALRKFDVGDVPIFPSSICFVKLEGKDECNFLGFTFPCQKAFTQDTLEFFGSALEQSHLLGFFLSFAIGSISLRNTLSRPFDLESKSLQLTCALYAIETSFFALIRFYWGMCKPMVVAGALHNLFEWSIVLQVSNADYNETCKRMTRATYFVGALVVVCVLIPDLSNSLGLEMLFGISFDFGLPLMFIAQLFDQKRRRVYRLAAAAHVVHLFGTILPLMFDIHVGGSVSWFPALFFEALINLTVPITHSLYCAWSHKAWDSPIDSSIESRLIHDDSSSTQSSSSEISDVDDYSQDLEKKEYKGGIPMQYRIENTKEFLTVGFLLGLVIIVPLVYFAEVLMEECKETARVGGPGHSFVWKSSTTPEDHLESLTSILGTFLSKMGNR